MKTAKLFLALCILAFITGLTGIKISQTAKESKFDQCTKNLGGATDTNCVKCEHLLQN